MKIQTIIRSITLGLVMLFVWASANTASAATVSLNSITVPSGGSRFSSNFTVNDRGQFTVTVKLRTNTLVGFGGQSRYRAELMRSTNTTVLDSAERTVSSSFESVTLSFNVATCSQTGAYRIRVRNISTDNPQQGIAEFPAFTVPSLDPTSGQLSLFGVTQGNTVNRTIPNSLEPTGTGGRMRVTATWDGLCGLDPAGCRLTFRLKHNGTTRDSSNGYSHNALFGNASPKMTLSYTVPANQVAGDWTLQVVGSSIADVSNVRPTVSFTPECQN